MAVEDLRSQRQRLPNLSGVYCFTNYNTALERNTGVLYVGKAGTLYTRVQSYLVDPAKLMVMSARSGGQRVTSSLRHAGKAQLLTQIQQKSRGPGPSGIFVRWTVTASPKVLENLLIGYLRPAFNTHGVD